MRTQHKIFYLNKIYHHDGRRTTIQILLNMLNYYYLVNLQHFNNLTSLLFIYQQVFFCERPVVCLMNFFSQQVRWFLTASDQIRRCADVSVRNNFPAIRVELLSVLHLMRGYFINYQTADFYRTVLQTFHYSTYLQYFVSQLNSRMSIKMPAWVKTPRWLKKFDKKKYKNFTKIYRTYLSHQYPGFQRCLLKRLLSVESGCLRFKYFRVFNMIGAGAWTPLFYTLTTV
jgi:hypothetical protein